MNNKCESDQLPHPHIRVAFRSCFRVAGVGGGRRQTGERRCFLGREGGVIGLQTQSNRGAGRGRRAASAPWGLPKGRLDGGSGSKRGPAGLRNKARRSRQEVIVGS